MCLGASVAATDLVYRSVARIGLCGKLGRQNPSFRTGDGCHFQLLETRPGPRLTGTPCSELASCCPCFSGLQVRLPNGVRTKPVSPERSGAAGTSCGESSWGPVQVGSPIPRVPPGPGSVWSRCPAASWSSSLPRWALRSARAVSSARGDVPGHVLEDRAGEEVTHCDKETPSTGLRSEPRPSWGRTSGSPEAPFPARAQPGPCPVPSPARHSDLFGGHSMFPGNPGHGEVLDAVSGPLSVARPRGQGVWAGPVYTTSLGSAKGPTHRAHRAGDLRPRAREEPTLWSSSGDPRGEACGVPCIGRPGAGTPEQSTPGVGR